MKKLLPAAFGVLVLFQMAAHGATVPDPDPDHEVLPWGHSDGTNSLPKDFTVEKFTKKPFKDQARFYKGLDAAAKMEFFNLYLPGRTFQIAEKDFIMFLKNGELLFDGFLTGTTWPGGGILDKDNKFFVGGWKADPQKGRLYLWPDKAVLKPHAIGDWEVWMESTALAYASNSPLPLFIYAQAHPEDASRLAWTPEDSLIFLFRVQRRIGKIITQEFRQLREWPGLASPSMKGWKRWRDGMTIEDAVNSVNREYEERTQE